MNTTDVIAFGALLVSAVAALVSVWQAGIASRARSEAQAARDEAAKHESDTLALYERIARSTEEHVELARLRWHRPRFDGSRTSSTGHVGSSRTSGTRPPGEPV